MYNNIALLLGHLVGDYLTQDEYTALNKSKKGIDGFLTCAAHCCLYSIMVAIFVVFGGWHQTILAGCPDHFMAFVIAFITHFPIDRWSLATPFMKMIGQSGFKEPDGGMCCNGEVTINKRNYFIAPIYIAVDNTLHLVLMWVLLSCLGA